MLGGPVAAEPKVRIQRITAFLSSDFTHYEKRVSTLRTWMARH